MVNELERTWPITGQSPETTWRARIVWRSVEDANAEVAQTLAELEVELSHTPQARASFLQLYRDFRRVQRKYLMMSSRHLIEQQAEVTHLLFKQQQQQQQHGLPRVSPATTASSRSSVSRASPSQVARVTPTRGVTPTSALSAPPTANHNFQYAPQEYPHPDSTPKSMLLPSLPAWSAPTAIHSTFLQQQQQQILNSLPPQEVRTLRRCWCM